MRITFTINEIKQILWDHYFKNSGLTFIGEAEDASRIEVEEDGYGVLFSVWVERKD